MRVIFLLILLFLSTIANAQIYIDPKDKTNADYSRYVDPKDPLLNELQPNQYVSPSDDSVYPGLNQINGVKPTQGNIAFYSSDGSVTILPDYLSSRINLLAQSGGDSNGVSWEEISALFPVPDANLSSLSWTKLLNYPTPCGASQAVQVIDDTLTCIDVLSETDANGLYVKLNPSSSQKITGFDLNVEMNLEARSGKFGVFEIPYLSSGLPGWIGIGNPGVGQDSGIQTDTDNFVVESTSANFPNNAYYITNFGQVLPNTDSDVNLGGINNEWDYTHTETLCLNGNCQNSWVVGDGNGSILGTANQVNVTNGLSRLFGDANIVLSLPQNIDTSATPQFVGLTLTPCSTFQMDTSPQLRFKVDCGASTVSSTTFIPVVSGTTDIGNTSNVWDDFWIQDINARNDINSQNLRIYGSAKIRNLSVDDLNASCADLNDGCLTQTDGNGLYVLKNPVSTQIINPFPNTLANPLDVNGNLRPLVTQVSNLGANGRRWNNVYAVRYIAVASTGQPSLVIQSNTGAYCVSGTDTCMDFNGQIRAITLSDNNIMYHGWGMTGSAFGLWYHYPSSTEPTFQAPFVTPDGTMWNKETNGLIQPMVFYRGKMNEVGSNLLDLNVTNDLNVSGDGNFHQNVKVDSNIFGQLVIGFAQVGTSCNTFCGAWSYGGPWACVEARTQAGTASTCTDTLLANNCMCRN